MPKITFQNIIDKTLEKKLIKTIELNDLDMFYDVIDLDVTPKIINNSKALLYAGKKNNLDMVVTLLDYGADINIQSIDGEENSIMSYVTDFNIIEFILEKGFDITKYNFLLEKAVYDQ